jgi:quercetin dioxygenase-like cupin family protein
MIQDRAGEYVLGLLSPQERDAVERDAAADPALANEIAFWNARLEPLLDVTDVQPPPGLFDRIQAAIAVRASDLPGTTTIRADEGGWETLVPGVERKVLWSAGSNGRVTFLIRGQPGARFPAHPHADDEECYVLAGDITFGRLTLHAGDYHLAARGAPHPMATTAGGCLLLVTAAA